jgi:hypothetical protein
MQTIPPNTPRTPDHRVGETEIGELEARFRTIVLLMYDTSVPLSVLEEKVCPYLADDVAFVDPAVKAHGYRKVRTGLRGFHCAFWFDFDIHDLHVRMHANNSSGQALASGVMNLRSIPGYVYPLRTHLVYDFVLGESGSLTITRVEEMWSLGDLIENAPLGIGKIYDGVLRPLAGYFLVGFFWLTCRLKGGKSRSVPWLSRS